MHPVGPKSSQRRHSARTQKIKPYLKSCLFSLAQHVENQNHEDRHVLVYSHNLVCSESLYCLKKISNSAVLILDPLCQLSDCLVNSQLFVPYSLDQHECESIKLLLQQKEKSYLRFCRPPLGVVVGSEWHFPTAERAQWFALLLETHNQP